MKNRIHMECPKWLSRIITKLTTLFEDDRKEINMEKTNEFTIEYTGTPDTSILFSPEVLDQFRINVGRFRPETGGMLASSSDPHVIDVCCFDTHSKNTVGSFYYDVESMSKVFRKWKSKGYVTNGIYHSHPRGVIQPSYHDISSALLHIRFFNLDYFYLPIFQVDKRSFYKMYFYVVRLDNKDLVVKLHYALRATENGYEYAPFNQYEERFPIAELDHYRASIERKTDLKKAIAPTEASPSLRGTDYFSKVQTLYPANVLDKVIVCVGVGGARSALENFARSGFRNFVLMDADIVSPTNVATQGVFISEMGKKKVEVVRDRIMDINPAAKVICVDKFLDDHMTDDEFKGYMDMFPGKSPTDYLILGCTDNFHAQKRSSMLALKYGTPYLAAMMYDKGAAAELMFIYPGVTEACPRCVLGKRFEMYEKGFQNDVGSAGCPIFATEWMNAVKGYIALMLLMYHEAPGSPFNTILDEVKNRNFVQIRFDPNLMSNMGIPIFDRAYAGASRYTFMGEIVWVPITPDRPEYGAENCRMCGGTGHLEDLKMKWVDTRLHEDILNSGIIIATNSTDTRT